MAPSRALQVSSSAPRATYIDEQHNTMPPAGHFLQDLTWVEAQALLDERSIVVVPLGAASKEHGPHLRLDNDWVLAQYLAARVHCATDVMIAPTVGYHYYPAFVEYPGSVTLRMETARDLIIDICSSLSAFGPRRFYALNTGVSTLKPLSAAADVLKDRGVLLRYTELRTLSTEVVRRRSQQAGGTHADEIETSIMLYIAPERVEMSKAANDYHPASGRLTRVPDGNGAYSASGIFGDATLASWDKGRELTETIVAGILEEIERLRNETLPSRRPPEMDTV